MQIKIVYADFRNLQPQVGEHGVQIVLKLRDHKLKIQGSMKQQLRKLKNWNFEFVFVCLPIPMECVKVAGGIFGCIVIGSYNIKNKRNS